ncbi:GntR family transcriptional regulator [Mucilaginibacter sp. UR6-11]|uniref:GntR family transcriptional regulator n=1 Tax=Mucilaginibacter sp. UR6-11 TaxID=1435644 RepID=UPI001E4AAC6B|nr:GntR family transcriptional regulator [Mucilaginibacter sp. UR6-11]MCC8425798.1 GntR family transcriptional regulator [Mucilaginibacter sp. UR6-11]
MEFKDNEPIYVQIAALICEKIITGQWPAGQRILSVRDLGVELEVNPNTVMRAYDFLQTLGVLYTKRGVGLFMADDAVEKVKAHRKQEFAAQYLPDFFKQLYLLDIPLDEIARQYQAFKEEQRKTKS